MKKTWIYSNIQQSVSALIVEKKKKEKEKDNNHDFCTVRIATLLLYVISIHSYTEDAEPEIKIIHL